MALGMVNGAEWIFPPLSTNSGNSIYRFRGNSFSIGSATNFLSDYFPSSSQSVITFYTPSICPTLISNIGKPMKGLFRDRIAY